MGKRITVAVCVGAALLAMVMTTVLAEAQIQGTAPMGVAATPEAAIAAAMQTSATLYAGDCATASSPQNLGQSCSKFVAQRADTRAYLTGRTFSEFSAWMFVQQHSRWLARRLSSGIRWIEHDGGCTLAARIGAGSMSFG